MWGHTPESLYERPLAWMDTIHPEGQGRVIERIEKRTTTGGEDIYRIVRSDGAIRWVRDRAFPIRDNNAGQIYRIIRIVEDITEWKATADELREIENCFSQITKTIEEVFWMCSPKTYQTFYVSPVYEKSGVAAANRCTLSQ